MDHLERAVEATVHRTHLAETGVLASVLPHEADRVDIEHSWIDLNIELELPLVEDGPGPHRPRALHAHRLAELELTFEPQILWTDQTFDHPILGELDT